MSDPETIHDRELRRVTVRETMSQAIPPIPSTFVSVLSAGENYCVWIPDASPPSKDATWIGSCGAQWSFIDGGPVENKMRFCPECGKPLVMPK